MKFQLVGTVWWRLGPNGEDRSRGINHEFEALTQEAAIEKARIVTQDFHAEHSHRADYGLSVELRLVTSVWKMNFRDEEPAQSETASVPAHLEEVMA